MSAFLCRHRCINQCGVEIRLWHDDVIKWKHFPRYWPLVRGIHRSPVISPHKDQWRGALMFSLIFSSTNGWVNNRYAGVLRRHGADYDVIVMYELGYFTLHRHIQSMHPSRVEHDSFMIWKRFSNCWRYERQTVTGGFPTHETPHYDVIKWKHFPRNWPFKRGIHRSPVNSPHKGQWRTALMFTLICVWINGCVNNREAGDLRCYYAHYGVTVMHKQRVLMHGHQGWNVRHGLCHIYMRYVYIYIYIYELFIAFVSFVVCSLLQLDGMCGVLSGQVAIKRKYRHVW